MRRWGVVALVTAAVLGLVASAVAARIGGTARAEVLRGTARADHISGGGGNDTLVGLGGNDVMIAGPGRDALDGGSGNDRLSTRDGERDTVRCGPGKDTVLADQLDRQRADCEIVRRAHVSPPQSAPSDPEPAPTTPEPTTPEPPSPPQATPVDAGSWKGATSTGNYVYFDVTSERTLRGFHVNDFRLSCDGDIIVYGPFGNVAYELSIDSAGAFSIDFHGDSKFADGTPTTLTIKVTGTVQGSTAAGNAYVAEEFDYEGRRYHCATEIQSWTAGRLP